MKHKKKLPKPRDVAALMHIARKGAGAGSHNTRARDEAKGKRRRAKHGGKRGLYERNPRCTCNPDLSHRLENAYFGVVAFAPSMSRARLAADELMARVERKRAPTHGDLRHMEEIRHVVERQYRR